METKAKLYWIALYFQFLDETETDTGRTAECYVPGLNYGDAVARAKRALRKRAKAAGQSIRIYTDEGNVSDEQAHFTSLGGVAA